MHGCGTCIWKAPAAGVHAVEGKFFGDEYVGEIMPCSTDDATDSAVDADVAAYQARSFQVWLVEAMPLSACLLAAYRCCITLSICPIG